MEEVLSPHEAAILRVFSAEEPALWLEAITGRSGLELAQARSAVERLKLKGALDLVDERSQALIFLSEAGQDALENGIPELRLVETLHSRGVLSIPDLQHRDDLPRDEAGAAFGWLKTRGLLSIEQGKVKLAEGVSLEELHHRQDLLAKVAAGPLSLQDLSETERGWINDRRMKAFFQIKEEKSRQYRLTPQGVLLHEKAGASAEGAGEMVGSLTPAMLKDGSWQGKRFRRYSIGLPPRLVAGYRNPYRRFLDQTKQTLLALGFEEMRGSLVENEFWNMDALFMPQFHPARDIHDVYYIDSPEYAREIPEPYLSNVAAAHEGRQECGSRGWGYLFDQRRAARLILRSQGTALSARQLAAQPKIPGKYFSMARCFRYDAVDATHASEFIQIEGIVLSEKVTFRHLLGILELFARVVAKAKEVRMVPDYFPFTEPSVQVHMKHPALGWIELGGAGLFRPELTTALGVQAPVIAWGLGLDRMAMVALDKNDIRHLFTNNLPRGLADNRSY